MKAQYFSFDAIMASVIFILTMTILFSYWYSTRSSLEVGQEELSTEAFRIAENLYSSYPQGLANSWTDRHMNITTIEHFIENTEANNNEDSFFDSSKPYLSSSFHTALFFHNTTEEIGSAVFPKTSTCPSEDYANSYKLRRIVPYYDDDKDQYKVGYFDIFVCSN